MPKLPRCPLYGFFTLPRGRLLKVHAEPCMYAPGYLQSNKPRWPAGVAGLDHPTFPQQPPAPGKVPA
jgi:hypothetical protein